MNPDQPLLDHLAFTLDSAIAEALGGARRVALLSFPNHNNPGDSALWLGALASLRRLGVKVVYTAVWDTLSPAALRAALPEGPILLNGGGNFGDLYAGQQGTREQVLAEFTDRPIIQLPQSIHFRHQDNLERNRALVGGHGRVTILAREAASEAFARDNFDATVIASPDAAFGLRTLPGPTSPPTDDVLWLVRRDGDPEAGGHGGPPEGVSARWMDWMETQPDEPEWLTRHRLGRRTNRALRPRAATDPRWARWAWRPLGASIEPLGVGFTRRGVDLLGRGRVVVVDRLHGHILALLAGVPHVVLDNNYGKVSGTHHAWTHPAVLATWADTGDQARATALQALAAMP